MDLKIIGIVAALVSAASWALGSILFKRIGENVSPFGMTLAKGIIGMVLLGVVYYIEGISFISLNVFVILVISGLIGIAIGDTLFFASLQSLGPKTQVIFFMLGQILTAVLGMIFLKEFPTVVQWIGILVTLSGVVGVLWLKIFSSSANVSTGLKGVIFGLFAMLCFSASLILAKDALSSISTIGATFYRIAAGTVGMMVFGLMTNNMKDWMAPLKKDIKMITFFFISVFVVMFGGFWLSLVAIKYVNIAVASTLNATEPLFVLPLAYFLMKEKVHRVEAIGAALTVVGVFLLTRGSL
ncbi:MULTISPECIES: DMT family transporter [unclassified Prosthecochloris]|uniref:DMT family transporter n=1 Tax=unclassified Prosthecochloris TaxID=2632826 RepID=UPI00223DDB1B|nr:MULTISPECIES: DMT family transporter [unclassified Prosthecochloris]UZJ37230.1 DMT family transporter [Prosthecochloris sp. SCSIO W1103]UZJ39043.1 DMT family transporter [Prosthecochloris sp. SCSIO W1102]